MRRIVPIVLALCTGLVFAQDGARLLVICADDYAAAVKPLVEWKHATGLPARLAMLSEVGPDSASVRRYIADAWANWPVRPEFVLLAASTSHLPARRVGNRWHYYTDNYYVNVTGDVKAELAVGRIPVTSASQVEAVVARTLAYEQSPELVDPDWMRRMTTIVLEGNDPDDTIYWGNVRYAAGLAGAAGFVNCDSFSANRGHNAGHVITSIDHGTGLVMYRGTAGGYWRPPFEVNPALTANGRKLPIILSFTCETMSLFPYESMLGNDWIATGTVPIDRGIVAFFGNTYSAMNVARQRGAVARGFFTGLFTEDRTRLGNAVLRAKELLLQQFPTDDEDYQGFTIFGDPSLRVWTGTPLQLSVAHPREILVTPQELEVAVSHSGLPVAGAVVCAWMDSAVYAVDTTDGTGTVALAVSPADTGQLLLTVTGQNLCPYQHPIRVVTVLGVEERILPARPAPVALRAEPTVFGRSTRLSWTGPGQEGLRLAIRDAAGRRVHDRPVAVVGSLGWNGTDRRGRELRSGIYFCSIEDRTGRKLAAARVRLVR